MEFFWNIRKTSYWKFEKINNAKGFPNLDCSWSMICHNGILTSLPMFIADNMFSPVSWYVLFETWGKHDINKIEIIQKMPRHSQFRAITAPWSDTMFSQSNYHQSLFCVVNIIDILLWYNRIILKHDEDIILIKQREQILPKGFSVLDCSCSMIWHNVILTSPHMCYAEKQILMCHDSFVLKH